VAKILVADDNSNIQKMVGLALKDQGIDVVAVGNGEAAVRKIADIKPDLVLADVFMPVRNGYEVCQFVKQDPALAHIPVILLVGAFDPLDEQEAQRVGADGVLKKPFVPPDPLIAMVKAALARAGVAVGGEKTEKAAKKAAEVIVSRPVPVPMSVKPPEPAPMVFEELESFVEEVPVQPASPPVEIHGGAPLAFGNLMGPTETAEDPGFTAPVAMERDWRAAIDNDEEVPEEEEAEAPKSSWRRDAVEDEVAAESGSGAGSGRRSWRDLSFGEPAARKGAQQDWDSEAAQPALTEAASTTANPGTSFVAASVPSISPATTLVQAELEPLPAISDDPWKSAISAGVAELENGNGAAHTGVAGALSNGTAPAALVAEASTRAVEHDAVAQAIDRFAEVKEAAETPSLAAAPTSGSAWELQALQATQLASTWDAPVRQAVVSSVEAVVAEVSAAPEATASQAIVAVPAATVEDESATPSYAAESLVAEPAREASAEPASESSAVAECAEHGVTPVLGFVNGALTEAAESAYTAPEVMVEPLETVEAANVAEPTPADLSLPEVNSHEVGSHQTNIQDAEHEVVRHHTSLPAEKQPEAHDAAPLAGQSAATSSAEPTPTQSAPANSVDADLVARVLASLSPEVMQAVTRELLKPVVEAMVREELNKKK
jgi:CheY-like chemotaxis protein